MEQIQHEYQLHTILKKINKNVRRTFHLSILNVCFGIIHELSRALLV